MVLRLPYLFLVFVALPAYSQEPLVFEAETCSTPEGAWVSNQSKPDKWTLWSTDVDAQLKCPRVVLQSPPVLKDREKAEEGRRSAHGAHRHPEGEWVVTSVRRGLAVSLDGTKWRALINRGSGRSRSEMAASSFWVHDPLPASSRSATTTASR